MYLNTCTYTYTYTYLYTYTCTYIHMFRETEGYGHTQIDTDRQFENGRNTGTDNGRYQVIYMITSSFLPVSSSKTVTTCHFGAFEEKNSVQVVIDARTSFSNRVMSSTFSSTVTSMSIKDQWGQEVKVSEADITTITRRDNLITHYFSNSMLTSDYDALLEAFTTMTASSITSESSE